MSFRRFEEAAYECEVAKDANFKASAIKSFAGQGAPELKNISAGSGLADKVVKKEIPHGSKPPGGEKANKTMALAWGQGTDPHNPDRRMAIVDQMGSCFVWNTVRNTRMYGLHYPFAQCLALNDDQEHPLVLVGGMRNATVLYKKVEESAIMKETKTWIQHDGYISSLHFLSDGKQYISSSGDAEVRIFDLARPPADPSLVTFRGHSKDCQSIKFASDDRSKNTFITCSSDKTVRMWDVRSGMCTAVFSTDSELNACCFFPTGTLVGCGGEKDKTYVFDVRSMKLVGKYARNNMKTASCEFSKSGRELYVGHDDGALVVWDIFGSGENRSYAKKLEAHTVYYRDRRVDTAQSRVQVLDVGPAGFLASGGFDGKVKIWGAPSEGKAQPVNIS